MDVNSGGTIRLPYSPEAEKAVLGAILRDPGYINVLADLLKPNQFFMEAHRQIFEAMLALDQNNEPTDLLTVAEKLRSSASEGGEAPSPAFLVDLTENCPVAQNIEYYAEIVKSHFLRRKVIQACQKVMKLAVEGQSPVDSFIGEIEKEFLNLADQDDKTGLVPVKDVLALTIKELEERITRSGELTGVPSGFADLDRITGGWQRSDLVILAARPAMGKTALALNLATNAARGGHNVAVFSLEMAQEQLMMRVLASEGKIDSAKLRSGEIDEGDQDRLVRSARAIVQFPGRLAIDQTPGISLTELRARCRRFKKESDDKLGLVIIDYLQLMTVGGPKNYDNREREVAEISRGLKAMAKELQLTVIALAQLNRGPDQRPDKRPKMGDLRESGSLEMDADQVLFVYRDEYYNENSEHLGKAEIIIGKNRHGETDKVFLQYHPNHVSFYNLSPRA